MNEGQCIAQRVHHGKILICDLVWLQTVSEFWIVKQLEIY